MSEVLDEIGVPLVTLELSVVIPMRIHKIERCSSSSNWNLPQHSCFDDLVLRPVDLRNVHTHMVSLLASISDAASSAPETYISCKRCTCTVHRESVALLASHWVSVSCLMPWVLSCNCLTVLCIYRPDSACR